MINTSRLENYIIAAEVEQLYTNYCEVLDASDIEVWPSFFTDDGSYRITTRENLENNMPLCFVLCEGPAMLCDRAAALKQTVFYRCRFQRRIVSGISVKAIDRSDGESIETCASFVIYESIGDEPSKLLVCGRSQDVIVREKNMLKFKQRLCIIDAQVISDSIVFPI